MIRSIQDDRKRRSIKMWVCAYVLIFAFAFQVSSFNDLMFWLQRDKTRFQHLIGKKHRLPKVDALRDIVKVMRSEDVKIVFDSVVDKAIENKVIRGNGINGLRVSAVDGFEYFKSQLKSCEDCMVRRVGKEKKKEHYHKAVVCMTVGNDPHIVLGVEMLKPKRDGTEKGDGEMTGVKRLLKEMNERHPHFADVIVADALYMNAPFINCVKSLKMDVVIRAKDERLHIVQEAMKEFKGREANAQFRDTNKIVDVWEISGLHMRDCPENIRFLRFVEQWKTPKTQKENYREVWCITTLNSSIAAHTVWLIMHKRWDIENNGFRMLKTYFNADHCYVHGKEANEKILLFIMISFNLMELFLFRRLKQFRQQNITRKHMIAILWDDLLLNDYSSYTPRLDGTAINEKCVGRYMPVSKQPACI